MPKLRIVARVGLGALLVSGGGTLPALSQELVTDRPDQTESAVTVPRSGIQIEVGVLAGEDEVGPTTTETLQLPATLVRLGLTERFELRIGWSGWLDQESRIGPFRDEDSGIGDAELGMKLRLRDEKGRLPEMALLVATSLPVGASALSSDRFDPSWRLAMANTLSDRLSIGYNVGMAWESFEGAGGRTTTQSVAIYSAALGIGLSERWGAFVELFGEVAASASGSPSHSFDGGITYLLRDNIQLDVAAGFGLSDAAEDSFVGIGVSFRMPR